MAAQLRWEWDSPGRERAVPGPRGRWFFVDAWRSGGLESGGEGRLIARCRAAGCGAPRTSGWVPWAAAARGCHATDTWTSCGLRANATSLPILFTCSIISNKISP